MNDERLFPREGRARRALTIGALALTALVVAGCGSRAPAPTQMDLGPAAAWPAQATLARRVDLQAVSAPETLQSTGIVYRLGDTDPYARRAYRDSRWAAPLPVLVAARLRQQIARAPVMPVPAGAETPAPIAVTLELEECLQHFSSASRSEVQLRVMATAEDGTQRAFDRAEPAGADAEGAVKATAAAVDALGPEIAAWAATLSPRVPQGRGRR
ncbi:ABC-type transport auxiliary lipoprotein family protein [Mitsuaria sp. GD03876]|uniref:ABC-type transport auxiliary lipoprotein family protein n=1 Tax=Mitsuaria sp. GD03876 TaxID=2975399 RepID=UPI00244BB674|nr:ABC-type transport auxiliary lipoprotein family protein [Mitsuaria sp. GD03876]MDH0867035.1 PqiC family protein [Mitsuaria sp. GD03876]